MRPLPDAAALPDAGPWGVTRLTLWWLSSVDRALPLSTDGRSVVRRRPW